MTKAAVIGLGTMGPGIAATLARAGLTVTAFDADAGQRAKAPNGFEIAAGALTRLGLPDRSAGVALQINRSTTQTATEPGAQHTTVIRRIRTI